MNAPLAADAQKEVIALLARQFIDSFEAVTKSREVAKEFYLTPAEIQQHTEENQKKIAYLAAKWIVDGMVKKGWPHKDLDEATTKKLHKTCLRAAYKRVKEST